MNDSYRDFPVQASVHTLFELASDTLRAVCKRFTLQAKRLGHRLAALDPIAVVIIVVIDDQVSTLGRQRVQTLVETAQAQLLFVRVLGLIDSRNLETIGVERSAFALVSFQSFEADEPSDLVAITTNVAYLDSFSEFSRDAIEDLVGLMFRERRAAPLKKPRERQPKVFISLARAFTIRV